MLALLHDEPGHPWTLDLLAAHVHVSRATLSRRFTELVGQSPMAYLTQWRLARAADLLREGGLGVEQVAHTVGYANAFAFSAAFKRAHGSSPRAFRSAPVPPGASTPSPADLAHRTGAYAATPGRRGPFDRAAGVRANCYGFPSLL